MVHDDHVGGVWRTYDERVEDGEPLNVGVRHGLQDVVPSAGPLRLHVHLRAYKSISHRYS